MSSETVFDRAARSGYGVIGPTFFHHYGQALIDRLAPSTTETVLDVATGTGCVLRLATSDARFVVGVDLAPAMLQHLRSALVDAGVRNAALTVMDATRLGFRAQAFDVLTAGFVMDTFANSADALREMFRVLRSGGRLGLSAAPTWWWQHDRAWQWHEDLLNDLDVDVGPARLTERQDWENALRREGFVDIEVLEDDYQLRWRNLDEWWRWCWSHGWRAVLEKMSPTQAERYRQVCEDSLSTRRHEASHINGKLHTVLAYAHRP